jgi:hypothetical protein
MRTKRDMRTMIPLVAVIAVAAIAGVPIALIATTSISTTAAACSLHGYKHGFCSMEKYIQDNPAEAKANGIKAPDDAAGKKSKLKDKK